MDESPAIMVTTITPSRATAIRTSIKVIPWRLRRLPIRNAAAGTRARGEVSVRQGGRESSPRPPPRPPRKGEGEFAETRESPPRPPPCPPRKGEGELAGTRESSSRPPPLPLPARGREKRKK